MSYSIQEHSFVLCAYGESPYLEECLESLLAQEEPSEVLIATSTPNDYIEGIAKRHGVEYFVSDDGGSGIAHDWNFALSCVKTPLATIAHQDDVYAPDYSKCMLEKVNQAQRPLIYFTDYGELRDGVKVARSNLTDAKRKLLAPLEKKGNWCKRSSKRRALSLGNAICCPSVTFVMDNLAQPVFNEGMRSNLDWEAWEKLSNLDGEFVYDPGIRMYHRIHDGSETAACIADNVRTQEDLYMLSKFWPMPVARLINKVYATAQGES